VPDEKLDDEVEKLLEVLQSKHQQGLRQFKFMINRGVECDLYTAQGFEALSAALTGAVNGKWEIEDADKGAGIRGFSDKDGLWQTRRRLAHKFWTD
jgi:enoyl-CoA hydratase